MPQRSLSATLSAGVGLLAWIALAGGIAGIHLGLWTPLSGFGLAVAGLLAGALALLLALVGLLRTRARSGLAGRARAWLGGVCGMAAIAAMLIGGAASNRGSAVIHDVSTDLEEPPHFSASVRQAPDRVNGVDYPDGGPSVPAQQRQAYPDLAPIELAASPAVVLSQARQSAEQLGWTVTGVDPVAGRLEAYEVTRIFRFVDDVVVRVRPTEAGGSRVDLRSNSRVGGGDLGANAARIRAFAEKLGALQ